jgi:hypothetical protein
MQIRTMAAISIGLLSAACQAPYSQNGSSASAPYYADTSPTLESSIQACMDYGFRAGTTNYDQCVSREQAARSTGRVSRDYAPAALSSDARYACSSYGLSPGTAGYSRCVAREMDARSYRDAAALPAASYRTDQYGYRVDANGYRIDAQGYSLDANGYRIATQTYPMRTSSPSVTPYSPPVVAGQAVSGDEFGNRYDALGNRVDGRGRIIPMRESR